MGRYYSHTKTEDRGAGAEQKAGRAGGDRTEAAMLLFASFTWLALVHCGLGGGDGCARVLQVRLGDAAAALAARRAVRAQVAFGRRLGAAGAAVRLLHGGHLHVSYGRVRELAAGGAPQAAGAHAGHGTRDAVRRRKPNSGPPSRGAQPSRAGSSPKRRRSGRGRGAAQTRGGPRRVVVWAVSARADITFAEAGREVPRSQPPRIHSPGCRGGSP